MSVINSMLRDLEHRKGQANSAPAAQDEDLIRGVVVPRAKWIGSTRAVFRGVAAVVVLILLWMVVNNMVDLLESEGVFENLISVGQVEESVDQPPEVNGALPEVEMAVIGDTAAPTTAETVELTAPSSSNQTLSDSPVVLLHDLVPIKEPSVVHKFEVSPTPDEVAGQAYSEAVRALRNGNKPAAEKALLSALELVPNHRGALEALSAMLISLGRYDEARELVDHGLGMLPDNTLLLQLKARLLMQGGQLDDAAKILEEHIPAVGASPEYRALLAAIYQKQQRYQKSAQLYGELLQLEPANGVWEMGLGIALESMGRGGEALSHYRRAINSGRLKAAALSFVEEKLRGVQQGDGP